MGRARSAHPQTCLTGARTRPASTSPASGHTALGSAKPGRATESRAGTSPRNRCYRSGGRVAKLEPCGSSLQTRDHGEACFQLATGGDLLDAFLIFEGALLVVIGQ